MEMKLLQVFHTPQYLDGHMMVIQSMVHMVMQFHSLRTVKVLVETRKSSQVMKLMRKPHLHLDHLDLIMDPLHKTISIKQVEILMSIMEDSVKLQNFPKEHMRTSPL